jgi:ubiquinone/menaquinone biosynthesis C-methylase UbiE
MHSGYERRTAEDAVDGEDGFVPRESGEIAPLRDHPIRTKGDDELSRDKKGIQEEGDDVSIEAMMSKVYDFYYSTEAYCHRYPVANKATLDFILKSGAATAKNMLDFGCGNGRYAMALLDSCDADIVGCDISSASLAEFSRRLQQSEARKRVQLVHGGAISIAGRQRFDMIMMMFGVLSHIGRRDERIRTLRQLRELMKPDGTLVLSVPNIHRRRPIEQLWTRLRDIVHAYGKTLFQAGDIQFKRKISGRELTFFYHLYSISGLRDELAQAGFVLRACRAESFLPEWLVTQYPIVAAFDRMMLRILPASLGYGICPNATIAPASSQT